jgi:hypothetical protein
MAVTTWPAYVLRGIPADTRDLLSEQAYAGDCSLADVIRQALCHRYQMDCEPASHGYQPALDSGGDELLVRIQPEVWRLMKKETRGMYGETKKLILQSIDEYLEATA